MFTVLIENKSYTCPTELTIKQWVDLSALNFENEYHYAKIFSIVMGTPSDLVELVPRESLELGMVLIYNLFIFESEKYKTKVNGHTLINFNNLKLSTFIDLDVLINENINKNFAKIVSILYEADEVDEWYINDVYASVQFYLKYRSNLYKAYSNLFNLNTKSDESDEFDEDDFNKKNVAYEWYNVVCILADEKYLNINSVLDTGVIEALNFLAWHKEKIKKQHDELSKSSNNF